VGARMSKTRRNERKAEVKDITSEVFAIIVSSFSDE
jgi:hypothetical protein